MLSVEEELIDRITATFHYLRTGKVPEPIAIPEDLPDNEIRQLITYVNRFLVEFANFAEAMEQIAQGELDTRPVFGRMAVVHSFKALQSNLRHLTWKTQQVAGGDLEQQVDFMGDFSTAFNRMTQPQRATRLGQGPIYIGWFLLILGTFLILVAALIHWRRLKLLEQGEIFSRSRWSLGLVVAFLLFGLGFFALVSHFFMF